MVDRRPNTTPAIHHPITGISQFSEPHAVPPIALLYSPPPSTMINSRGHKGSSTGRHGRNSGSYLAPDKVTLSVRCRVGGVQSRTANVVTTNCSPGLIRCAPYVDRRAELATGSSSRARKRMVGRASNARSRAVHFGLDASWPS